MEDPPVVTTSEYHHLDAPLEGEISDAPSRTSSTSFHSSPSPSTHTALPFTPTLSLDICTRGLPVLHIPGPPTETTTPILSAAGEAVYFAHRTSRWSAVLTLQDPSGRELAKVHGDRWSNFVFRAPIDIDVLGEEIKMKRKGVATRSCVFEVRGEEWVWRYGKKSEGARLNGHTLLVLERQRMGEEGRERLAQLVRDEREDEIQGATKWGAGRGGRLDLGVDGEDERVVLVVVVTCLEMLKKEVDRRRFVHPLPVTPVFSGREEMRVN